MHYKQSASNNSSLPLYIEAFKGPDVYAFLLLFLISPLAKTIKNGVNSCSEIYQTVQNKTHLYETM